MWVCTSYLLGLLAMIKCSICSYQCDNWYVSNWRLACHIYFSMGRRSLELAQRPLRVALALHIARRGTPFGVTIFIKLPLLTTYSWQLDNEYKYAIANAQLHKWEYMLLGAISTLKNSWSHIDASLSRQPLVKGERLVRLEVNAVISLYLAIESSVLKSHLWQ